MNNLRIEAIEIERHKYNYSDYKLYLDECMCLYNTSNECNDNCIKRCFSLEDLEGTKKTLFVCQSYLRYKIQELKFNNSNYYGFKNYEDVIAEIIISALNLDKYTYSKVDYVFDTENDILKRKFAIPICYRPYVYVYLDINEYIEYAYKNIDIARSLVEQLRSYFNKIKYKKYKTKYKKVIGLLNRIEKQQYMYLNKNDFYIETDMLEIFKILYDMKINEKLNNK